MNFAAMISQTMGAVKTFLQNTIAIVVAVGVIFMWTVPTTEPIESAAYKAVAIGDKLLFEVSVGRDADYGAEMILYIDNDYVGTMQIPRIGHRVTRATFPLPPSANQNKGSLLIHWRLTHWTDIVLPQELFYRAEGFYADTSST